MTLYNPYTHGYIEYPLDLEDDNIIRQCFIEHETFFCPWHTQWSVLYLYNGDVIYIPYGNRNHRKAYIVTAYYLNRQIEFPYGVYTIDFMTLATRCSRLATELSTQTAHYF